MADVTESLRGLMAKSINDNPMTREELETVHGKGNVWDTEELKRDFDVIGFAAPFTMVRRKSDEQEGVVTFQHNPRFYWGFSTK